MLAADRHFRPVNRYVSFSRRGPRRFCALRPTPVGWMNGFQTLLRPAGAEVTYDGFAFFFRGCACAPVRFKNYIMAQADYDAMGVSPASNTRPAFLRAGHAEVRDWNLAASFLLPWACKCSEESGDLLSAGARLQFVVVVVVSRKRVFWFCIRMPIVYIIR